VIVVLASTLLEVLLRTPAAEAVEDWLFGRGETLHVDTERGRAALANRGDFPLIRYPHHFLLPRVWELRNNLTAHDAVYVALAEALDALLLTRDQRLARATGHRARVKLVG